MAEQNKEARLILALQALQSDPKLSLRAAAKIYSVALATLSRRKRGQSARCDTMPKSRKLTESEEEALIKYILELDSRAFPPRPSGVEDMANRLLADRDAGTIGKNWVVNFVKRREELGTHWIRKYDYQRAKCEDPKLVSAWFDLVRNSVAKYGILDDDIYNFDETGFLMGMIAATMVITTSEGRGKAKLVQPGNREWATVIQGVNCCGWAIPPFIIVKGQYHLANWYSETDLPRDWVISTSSNGWTTNELGLKWIQHFDRHTASRTKGTHRLLVLDGHESHHSTDFELYCREHNIITLCMPPHSSHFLQPLDFGCFGPLKKAYGRQVEDLIRSHVNHVTKVEFLSAFKAAFFASMTEGNIRGGFRGAGLAPFDPDSVLEKLDVRLQTPTPPREPLSDAEPWTSKTPQTARDAASQSEHIKTRISNHQSSSPSPMLAAVDQLTKGARAIMHRVNILEEECSRLRRANEALSKRRRAKKTRVRLGGSLTIAEVRDVLDQQELDGQLQQEIRDHGGQEKRATTTRRRCGTCGKTGHNARTCQEEVKMSDVYSSE